MEYTKIFKNSALLQGSLKSQKKVKSETLKVIPRHYLKASVYLSFRENKNHDIFQDPNPPDRLTEQKEVYSRKVVKKFFGKKVHVLLDFPDRHKALSKQKTIQKIRLSSYKVSSLKSVGDSVILVSRFGWEFRGYSPNKLKAMRSLFQNIKHLSFHLHFSQPIAFWNLKYLSKIKSLQNLRIVVENDTLDHRGDDDLENEEPIFEFQKRVFQMSSLKRFLFDFSEKRVDVWFLQTFLNRFTDCTIPAWYLRFKTRFIFQPSEIRDVLQKIDVLGLSFHNQEELSRRISSRGYRYLEPFDHFLKLSDIVQERKKVLEFSFEQCYEESLSDLLDFLKDCRELKGLSVIGDGGLLQRPRPEGEGRWDIQDGKNSTENQEKKNGKSKEQEHESLWKMQEFDWLEHLEDVILFSADYKNSQVFQYLLKSLQSKKKNLQTLKICALEMTEYADSYPRGGRGRGSYKYKGGRSRRYWLDFSLFKTLKGFHNLKELDVIEDKQWNAKNFRGFFTSKPQLTKLKLTMPQSRVPWDKHIPFWSLDQLTELRLVINEPGPDDGNNFVKSLHKLHLLQVLEVYEEGRRRKDIGYLNKMVDGLSHLKRLRKVIVKTRIQKMRKVPTQDLFCDSAKELLKLTAEAIIGDIKEKVRFMIGSFKDLEVIKIGDFVDIPGLNYIRYLK